MAIRTLEQAKKVIKTDAAARAYTYLDREVPGTINAISFMVNKDGWGVKEVMDYFLDVYGETEEKTMHKIELVVSAMVAERDEEDNQ